MIGVLLILALLLYLQLFSSSLIIVTLSAIISIVMYKFNSIFKQAHWWYIGSILLSITAVVFYQSPYLLYVTHGYLAYSTFLVVMMVGVLPNRWEITRKIKKHRGVLSIMGFILISPHAFLHVFGLFSDVNLFGIAAYVLMFPLTIISFKIIRKEMNPKDWFTVQKAAYVIYISLFVHLLMVADWFDKIIYAVLLVLYVNNKLYKEFRK